LVEFEKKKGYNFINIEEATAENKKTLFTTGKEYKMKKVITITAVLMLIAVVSIAKDSPKDGNVGFRIAVPALDTTIKQGETQIVTISLEKGESFKQDVTLEIKLAKGEGLIFDPAKTVVKATDKPNVDFVITVRRDAALGEYKISVTGTPTKGEPTSVEFNVKVEAP
jgi:uncharacterized membrane protein